MSDVITVRSVKEKPASVIVMAQREADEFDALADSQDIFYHFRDVLPTATFDELARLFEQHAIQKRRGLW